MFVVREHVREHLARVVLVRETVDDRYARVFREALDDVLPERADHDDVHHARNDLCCVFDRFAAPKLRVARAHEDGVAAKLENAGFERQTRAR